MTVPKTIVKLLSKKKKLSIIVEDMESNTGCPKLKLNNISNILIVIPNKNIPKITPLIPKLA